MNWTDANLLEALPPLTNLERERVHQRARIAARRTQTPEEWVAEYADGLVREYYKRHFDDALVLYKARQPAALAFHRSKAHIRIVTAPNQAGKTLTSVAEAARIVRGQHPDFPKKKGIMLCVGLDGDHIAQNMWKMMSLPGAFSVIEDEKTGAPRPIRIDPDNPAQVHPEDEARRGEWIDAPAFLPPEEWDYPMSRGFGVAWEDKAVGCPRIVRVRSTGWEMLWHPSGGHPRRGIKLNYAWFDEELAKADWFYETVPRMLRFGGRITWSATPQENEIELYKLHKRVLAGDPDVAEFSLSLEANPFISVEAKRKMYNTLAAMSQEHLNVRYYGKWGIAGRIVYPQWAMDTLGVDGFNAA